MTGFSAWLIQRLTAVYLLIFCIIFLSGLIYLQPITQEIWQNWFTSIYLRLAIMLFYFSLLLHAWLGIREVIIDYIHPILLRLFTYLVVFIFLLINGLWILNTLWI